MQCDWAALNKKTAGQREGVTADISHTRCDIWKSFNFSSRSSHTHVKLLPLSSEITKYANPQVNLLYGVTGDGRWWQTALLLRQNQTAASGASFCQLCQRCMMEQPPLTCAASAPPHLRHVWWDVCARAVSLTRQMFSKTISHSSTFDQVCGLSAYWLLFKSDIPVFSEFLLLFLNEFICHSMSWNIFQRSRERLQSENIHHCAP